MYIVHVCIIYVHVVYIFGKVYLTGITQFFIFKNHWLVIFRFLEFSLYRCHPDVCLQIGVFLPCTEK